jgi:hypothetical protein
MGSSDKVTKNADQPWVLRTIYFSWFVCVATILCTVSQEAGGYGLILWAWHPVLLTLGVWGVMPLGLFSYSNSDPTPRDALRRKHGLLMAAASLLMLFGYAAAWAIHEGKSHRHLPAWPPLKPISRVMHVYGGLAVLMAIAVQCATGVMKALKSESSLRILKQHEAYGVFLWAAAAAVTCTGLYIPFVEAKTGNVAVGVGLIVAASAAAFFLLRRFIVI